VAAQLQATTIDLIDNCAWMFQARRTSLPQRQALIGWLDTIRKIGKGTGIRAPRLRAEAARKMTECWGAVPVWVMPLSRVVENFDPGTSRFDVVILDEASQSDVMALVALYLGHNVVLVGDHEQVSPSAVGQETTVIQNLIDQFLQGIPNAHLYDGQTSVYDLERLTKPKKTIPGRAKYRSTGCFLGIVLKSGRPNELPDRPCGTILGHQLHPSTARQNICARFTFRTSVFPCSLMSRAYPTLPCRWLTRVSSQL
jgi:hypothetical protein